ncbi:hypothetical protein F5Y05DRAFT_367201 [Hypoxylon sp. FL0543]|nr:hypothetical protein F5Y05DRAFT_367201 [Hypoxylon sp. FL0543]
MDSLRREACDIFFSRVESRGLECDAVEISSPGGDTIYSEKRIRLDEVQRYLGANPGHPTFKLVHFNVRMYDGNHSAPFQHFTWLPDVAKELGIEIYMLGNLVRPISTFQTTKQNIQGGNVLNLYYDHFAINIIASYSPKTHSTTCLVFTTGGSRGREQLQPMTEYAKQNRMLFQNSCFLPLVLLATIVKRGGEYLDKGSTSSFDLNDKENLEKWEVKRGALRFAQQAFDLATDMSNYMRESLGAAAEQGKAVPQAIFKSSMEIREAVDTLDLCILPAKRGIEWRMRLNDDYMAHVRHSRTLSRYKRLTPSGPVPFTVVIVILWLAITQRQQIRSVVDASMERWSAKNAAP